MFDLVRFRGHTIYVKRDDLFVLQEHRASKDECKLALSGNKARKLFSYLKGDFPEISKVVSHGSVQSNMLYSLAVLAKIKGWSLEFYVDQIPSNLVSNPRGNYGEALALGADIRAIPKNSDDLSLEQFVKERILSEGDDVLYIPEGGAALEAEMGLKALAEEIETWVTENQIDNPKLMLPSGTGTTAYFLQKRLSFEVLTCACVGTAEYLLDQFCRLENNNKYHPTVLPPIVDSEGGARKFHFGKLYRAFYEIWSELKEETGITFDLLYDPLGWVRLMDYLNSPEVQAETPSPTMIYLHQGGLLGNETMLQRYERKYGFLP